MSTGALLPGPLRLAPAFAFAGRAAELAMLKALLPRTRAEGRRAALVAGEAGSGKSRLVRELAHNAAQDGAIVLYGGSDVVAASPYGPFAEALAHLVRHAQPDALREQLGADAGELTRLLPDLPAHVGEVARPAAADADTERHRLHTAVTNVLARVSASAPLLLVLEDLHWADGSTLLLVRHLVRSGADARMLLVCTFRDAASDVSPGLGDTLVDVHRTEGVARVRLGGLSQPEIEEFVRLATGVEPAPELVDAISALTGGNAFLVTELWRELAGSGAVEVGPTARLARPPSELGAPRTVQELVNQRLTGLTAAASSLLELAAVAGANVELHTLRRTAVLAEPALLDAVDEAVGAGLLVEEPGRGLGYRFAHELVRRAVVDRLSARRTGELHLVVAEALESDLGRREDRTILAGLAHHFAAAAAVGGVDRAVEYNLLAAESAIRAVAFDEAVNRFRTALELGLRDPEARATVMHRLGEACHRAGAAADALEAFSATADLARELGDADLLARAAIGFEEACWRPAILDGRAVDLLEEAASALGPADSGLRARVLGGLARALELRGDPIRAAEEARDASVAMSRRLGDRPSLGATLAAAYWSRGVSTNDEVKEMLLEAQALGRELGDVELEAEATSWLVPTHVVLCDHESAREAVRQLLSLAERTGEPFRLHVAEHYLSALALCDGDLATADASARRSHEWGRLLTGRNASGSYGIQMFGIRRAQGRLAELAPAVRLLDAGALDGAWRPGLVVVLAELGMDDEARRELRRILDDGLGVLRPSLWLASLVYIAEAAALLDDVPAAEALYQELAVYAGGNVMVGHLVACYGAADRYLGDVATVLGEWELAQEHFEAALALDMRLGARTWLAHTSFAFARMLLARGRPEDRSRARELLAAALGLAEAIGLRTLEGRIAELRVDVPRAAALPDGLSEREAQILVELARGRSNRDIGRLLHISEHTAANHVRSILRKTRCANRTEAAGYALRRGLVPD